MKEEALNKRRKLYVYLGQTNAILAENNMHCPALEACFGNLKHRKRKAVVQTIPPKRRVSGTATEEVIERLMKVAESSIKPPLPK